MTMIKLMTKENKEKLKRRGISKAHPTSSRVHTSQINNLGIVINIRVNVRRSSDDFNDSIQLNQDE